MENLPDESEILAYAQEIIVGKVNLRCSCIRNREILERDELHVKIGRETVDFDVAVFGDDEHISGLQVEGQHVYLEITAALRNADKPPYRNILWCAHQLLHLFNHVAADMIDKSKTLVGIDIGIATDHLSEQLGGQYAGTVLHATVKIRCKGAIF